MYKKLAATSSSPKECLRLCPGFSRILGCIVLFVETKISLVNLWILPINAAFACSSSSNRDCNFTCPASSCITYRNNDKYKPLKWACEISHSHNILGSCLLFSVYIFKWSQYFIFCLSVWLSYSFQKIYTKKVFPLQIGVPSLAA